MLEATANRNTQEAMERGHEERARAFRRFLSALRPRIGARRAPAQGRIA